MLNEGFLCGWLAVCAVCLQAQPAGQQDMSHMQGGGGDSAMPSSSAAAVPPPPVDDKKMAYRWAGEGGWTGRCRLPDAGLAA